MKKELLSLLAEKNISEEIKNYFYEEMDNFDDFQLNLIYDTLVAKSDEDFWNVVKKNNNKIKEIREILKTSVHDVKRELYIRAEEELDKTRPKRLEDLLRMM